MGHGRLSCVTRGSYRGRGLACNLPPPTSTHRENANKKDVRLMNIEAAKAVADAIRTSLGPRGADKMVRAPRLGGI